jgi:D-alanyl-lipoteichoic acid acyltransferase DltB (MBOAT superfamily)
MSWNPKYALLMLASTVITFLSGIYIEKASKLKNKDKGNILKKWCVGISFFSNLSILFFFKYFNFANENITILFDNWGINWNLKNFDILLPVGISFYTFQALSYTMDVYRGKIKTEEHFGKYALFVSFFPQLVAGPIERSNHLLPQFSQRFCFDSYRIREGLLLMLWGFFKKLVIADRLSILVNTVYNSPTNYQGTPLIIATIFFAFQIYCDFSSYSDIAIGAAKVMGYSLMSNFNRPYFSKSISEFWRRWHISLSSWFKDYLYLPLGGSKIGLLKRIRNIIFVFFVSGLWHGASWNFIIWGLLHGFYQIFGIISKPYRNYIVKLFSLKKKNYFYQLYRITITFALVNFSWIFFRANTVSDAIYIITNISRINSFDLSQIGLSKIEFKLSIFLILFLIVVQVIQSKTSIIAELLNKNLYIRWLVYYIAIFSIIIFGSYGDGVVNNFIYFQF